MVFGGRNALGVLLDTAALDLLDLLDHGDVDAVRIVDIAVGIGHGHDLGAQLLGLLRGVDGHVAGTGDHDGLALEGVVAQHAQGFLGVVAHAVTGGLGAGQGAAEFQTLTGQDAGVLVADALVLAEQVADLTAAHVDVAGGNVGELADVTAQLGHEGLAEAHDFRVGLALRVEVGAALAAAHRQRGQGVLQDLLETEELDDALVDGRVEAQAALVRADGGIELHAVTTVDLHLAFVVGPGDAELHHALRFDDALEHTVLLVFRVLCDDRLKGVEHFVDGLQKFGLIAIAGHDLVVDALDVLVSEHCSPRFDR